MTFVSKIFPVFGFLDLGRIGRLIRNRGCCRGGRRRKMISQEQGDNEYQTGLEIFLSLACIHKIFLDNYFYWGLPCLR